MNYINVEVVIAWLLFVPIVVYNVRHAFAVYRVDAKLWKLIIHAATVTCFGLIIVHLGVFTLRTQFNPIPLHKSQFANPKLERAEAVPEPARGTPAQHKHAHKK